MASVNAERRPDLRAAILDGSFQASHCPACDAAFRLDPVLTYLDIERLQWILVKPADELAGWLVLEQEARAAFDLAYGAAAPRPARALGLQVRPRITFGWAALREKILCAELGVDDAALETLKCALLRSLPETPLADDIELRLTGGSEEMLELAWVSTTDEAPRETMTVPRDLYDEVLQDPAWETLRETMAAATFVDMQRLMVEPADQPPA